MLTHCCYCSLDTAGMHRPGCPNAPTLDADLTVFPWPVTAPQGWECPKCGRVYSPSFPMCTYCPAPTHRTAEASA
jgi:hypothetical protein